MALTPEQREEYAGKVNQFLDEGQKPEDIYLAFRNKGIDPVEISPKFAKYAPGANRPLQVPKMSPEQLGKEAARAGGKPLTSFGREPAGRLESRYSGVPVAPPPDTRYTMGPKQELPPGWKTAWLPAPGKRGFDGGGETVYVGPGGRMRYSPPPMNVPTALQVAQLEERDRLRARANRPSGLLASVSTFIQRVPQYAEASTRGYVPEEAENVGDWLAQQIGPMAVLQANLGGIGGGAAAKGADAWRSMAEATKFAAGQTLIRTPRLGEALLRFTYRFGPGYTETVLDHLAQFGPGSIVTFAEDALRQDPKKIDWVRSARRAVGGGATAVGLSAALHALGGTAKTAREVESMVRERVARSAEARARRATGTRVYVPGAEEPPPATRFPNDLPQSMQEGVPTPPAPPAAPIHVQQTQTYGSDGRPIETQTSVVPPSQPYLRTPTVGRGEITARNRRLTAPPEVPLPDQSLSQLRRMMGQGFVYGDTDRIVMVIAELQRRGIDPNEMLSEVSAKADSIRAKLPEAVQTSSRARLAVGRYEWLRQASARLDQIEQGIDAEDDAEVAAFRQQVGQVLAGAGEPVSNATPEAATALRLRVLFMQRMGALRQRISAAQSEGVSANTDEQKKAALARYQMLRRRAVEVTRHFRELSAGQKPDVVFGGDTEGRDSSTPESLRQRFQELQEQILADNPDLVNDPDEVQRVAWDYLNAQVGRIIAEDELFPAVQQEPAPPTQAGQTPTVARMAYLLSRPLTSVSVPTSEINVDPVRFQFKGEASRSTGQSGSLAGAKGYMPGLAGHGTAWQDMSGRIWAVNMHNRHGIAVASGYPTEFVNLLREADGVTDNEAMLVGALQNISENNGTALDAARIFKQLGIGPEELRALFVPVKGRIARQGMSLSKLSDNLLELYRSGKMPENLALMLGEELPGDQAAQEAAFKLWQRRRSLSADVMRQVIEETKRAPESETQGGMKQLFEEDNLRRKLTVEKAEITAEVRNRLMRDKRLFGRVSDDEVAARLKEEGTQVDVPAAKRVATISQMLGEHFDHARKISAELNAILDEGAVARADGGTIKKVVGGLYERVRKAVEADLAKSGVSIESVSGKPSQRSPAPTGGPGKAPGGEGVAPEGNAGPGTTPNAGIPGTPEPPVVRPPAPPLPEPEAGWGEEGPGISFSRTEEGRGEADETNRRTGLPGTAGAGGPGEPVHPQAEPGTGGGNRPNLGDALAGGERPGPELVAPPGRGGPAGGRTPTPGDILGGGQQQDIGTVRGAMGQPAATEATTNVGQYSRRYVPITGDGSHPAPRQFREPLSLSGLPFPNITGGTLHPLVERARQNWVLADEQIDAHMLTRYAWHQGHGILVADDVGTGKSRVLAANALHLLATGQERGQPQRILITTFNRDNIADLIREMGYVFSGDASGNTAHPYPIVVVMDHPGASNTKGGKLPVYDNAIYLVDSHNIAAYTKAIKELKPTAWMADEVAKFRGSGDVPAKRAAWDELHRVFPDIPMSYFSATPAESLEQMEYLYALREWLPGRFDNWLLNITGHGRGAIDDPMRPARDTDPPTPKPPYILPAQMEQVMRELKARGKFISRDLNREGLVYRTKTRGFSEQEKSAYNRRADFARDVLATIREFLHLDTSRNRTMTRLGLGRSFLQFVAKRLQFDLRLEDALTEAREAIANGQQAIVQVINVSEADPVTGHLGAAINRIPIGHKNPQTGAIIPDPAAMAAVEELRRRAPEEAPALRDPIAFFKEAFGEDNIAVVTGNESTLDRQRAVADFQAGRRKVAILSGAGQTGLSLHDVNGAQRVILPLDQQWTAADFLQALGRGDRIGQVSSPIITFLSTGSAAEERFASQVANRLRSLGAVAKGSAEATGIDPAEAWELGSALDEHALARAWSRRFDSRLRSRFLHDSFIDWDHGGMPRDVIASSGTMRQFLMDLGMLHWDEANTALRHVLAARQELIDEGADPRVGRTGRAKGELLRVTNITDMLKMAEVRNEEGHKFGILYGVLSPHMNTLSEPGVIGENRPGGRVGQTAVVRSYTTFTTSSGQQISGLTVPWDKVGNVFRRWRVQQDWKTNTLAHLRAGDTIPVGDGPGRLRWREGTEASGIEVAAMGRHAEALRELGAIHHEVGDWWELPHERLNDFLAKFPIRQEGRSFSRAEEGKPAGYVQQTITGEGDVTAQGGRLFEPEPAKAPRPARGTIPAPQRPAAAIEGGGKGITPAKPDVVGTEPMFSRTEDVVGKSVRKVGAGIAPIGETKMWIFDSGPERRSATQPELAAFGANPKVQEAAGKLKDAFGPLSDFLHETLLGLGLPKDVAKPRFGGLELSNYLYGVNTWAGKKERSEAFVNLLFILRRHLPVDLHGGGVAVNTLHRLLHTLVHEAAHQYRHADDPAMERMVNYLMDQLHTSPNADQHLRAVADAIGGSDAKVLTDHWRDTLSEYEPIFQRGQYAKQEGKSYARSLALRQVNDGGRTEQSAARDLYHPRGSTLPDQSQAGLEEGLPGGARRGRLDQSSYLPTDSESPKERGEYHPKEIREFLKIVDASGKERAVAGMDPRITTVFGNSMYEGDKGRLTAKEVFQNSQDAVRHLMGGGNVTLRWNPDAKVITIVDNGSGMTPEVVSSQWVDIAGSLKDVDLEALTKKVDYTGSNDYQIVHPSQEEIDAWALMPSGGFGVAKIVIFSNAKSVYLKTVADTPEGRIQTTAKGSGDDWADQKRGLELAYKPAENQKLGTHLAITFKDDAEVNRYQMDSFLRNFLTYSRVPGKLRVEQVDSSLGEAVPMSPDRPDVRHIAYIKVEGATLEILGSKGIEKSSAVPATILNNGLPQFSHYVSVVPYGGSAVPVPKELVIDVHADAGPEQSGYPFMPNRQTLRYAVAQAIQKYAQEQLGAQASIEEVAKLHKLIATAPEMPGTKGLKLLDFSGGASPEFLKANLTDPAMHTLSKTLATLYPRIAEAFRRYHPDAAENVFAGMAFGREKVNSEWQDFLGQYLRNSQISQGEKDTVWLNIYPILREVKAAISLGVIPKEGLGYFTAGRIIGTLFHEGVHSKASGHREDFAGIQTRFDSDESDLFGALRRELAVVLGRNLELFKKDLFKSWEELIGDYDKDLSGKDTNVFEQFVSSLASGGSATGGTTARGDLAGGGRLAENLPPGTGNPPSGVPEVGPSEGGRGRSFLKTESETDRRHSAALGTLTKGFDTFRDEDVAPLARTALRGVLDTYHRGLQLLSPTAGVKADKVDTVSHMLGQTEKSMFAFEQAHREIKNIWDRTPHEAIVRFVDNFKAGNPQDTPELQAIDRMYRQADRNLFQPLIREIRGEDFPLLENHLRVFWKSFPHWEGTTKGGGGMGSALGRAPLRGSMKWMRQHVFESMSEGLEMGGQPTSWNPQEWMEWHYRDLLKYANSTRAWQEAKVKRWASFVRKGQKVPEGFVELEDNIAKASFVKYDEHGKAFTTETGQWYVHPDFGRLLNNYLSPDKIKQTPFWNALYRAKMFQTGWELMFNGAHWMNIGWADAAGRMNAMAREFWNIGVLQKNPRAMLHALTDLSPSYFKGRQVVGLIKSVGREGWEQTREGREMTRMLGKWGIDPKEFIDWFWDSGMRPGSNTGRYADDMIDMAQQNWHDVFGKGAARWKEAPLYRTPEMIARLGGAAANMLRNPLFEVIIPRVKMGTFLKELPIRLMENRAAIESGRVSPLQVARDLRETIDNRFGEINRDAEFRNNTVRSVLTATFRAYGWALGNVREAGKAPTEALNELYWAVREKRAPQITPRAGWMVSEMLLLGTAGYMIHWLLTGRKPETMRDLYNPGEEGHRIQFFGYPAEWQSAVHSPVAYGSGKIASGWKNLSDVLHNEDFMNVRIYEPDDSTLLKTGLVVTHLMGVPLGFGALERLEARGDQLPPWLEVMLASGAMKPGPRWVDESKAEAKMADISAETKWPSISRDTAAHRRLIGQLTRKVEQAGAEKPKELEKYGGLDARVQQILGEHAKELTEADVENILRQAGSAPKALFDAGITSMSIHEHQAVSRFRKLDWRHAVEVWALAKDKPGYREKMLFQIIMQDKAERAVPKMTEKDLRWLSEKHGINFTQEPSAVR